MARLFEMKKAIWGTCAQSLEYARERSIFLYGKEYFEKQMGFYKKLMAIQAKNMDKWKTKNKQLTLSKKP